MDSFKIMSERRRRTEPKQKYRGENPANNPSKHGVPKIDDIIRYGDTAWIEKYNEHKKAGNNLAAFGWSIAGTPRRGFAQRYEVTGKNTVTPKLSSGQESVLRGFEAAQTVVNLAKAVLGDNKDKPKGHIRAKLKDVFSAGKTLKDSRKERIKSGGGIFNRLVGDRYAERVNRDRINREYVSQQDLDYWERMENGQSTPKVDLKKHKPTTPDPQPTTPPVDLKKHRPTTPDVDPITAPIPVVDVNKDNQPAPDTTSTDASTGSPQPEATPAPDKNGDTASNGSSRPEPIPSWVADALRAKLERDAAEAAQREVEATPTKPEKIDNTGHVVIDMPTGDDRPRTEEDFIRNANVDLPPEPDITGDSNNSIADQEVSYTQTKVKGPKAKTK